MRIILLLIALLIVAWLTLSQFKAINQVSAPHEQNDSDVLVPKNAQDLKQLKNQVDSLIQKSADNTQQQIDKATNQEKTN